ncbi:MAG: hypothetical protein LBM66_04605 [Bifidobacteriaceae bacterium]|jgi:hypothetical protein|nr:hypothetical protein [Bifidobacteriaceae bacterium]
MAISTVDPDEVTSAQSTISGVADDVTPGLAGLADCYGNDLISSAMDRFQSGWTTAINGVQSSLKLADVTLQDLNSGLNAIQGACKDLGDWFLGFIH